MGDSKQRYDRAHNQDTSWFREGIEVYRGNGIVIIDVRHCFRPMQRPWKRRPGKVCGLFVHHRASWNSYHAMQHNVVMPRYEAAPGKRHDRIAYTFGVHHRPQSGDVVIYQFNDLEANSWHSGSPGKDSERFRAWRRLQGPGNSANSHTVGLNLSGFFSSRGYPENHPAAPTAHALKHGRGGTLIGQPSIEQCRAVWGLWAYLVDEHGASGIFGHIDSGKTACPGDVAMELVNAISRGLITCERDLDRWLSGRDDVILPGGWPESGAPGNGVDYSERIQRELVRLGYDIGASGPGRDGIDGQWGKRSRLALMDWEETAGELVNGEPDKSDYDELSASSSLSAPVASTARQCARSALMLVTVTEPDTYSSAALSMLCCVLTWLLMRADMLAALAAMSRRRS